VINVHFPSKIILSILNDDVIKIGSVDDEYAYWDVDVRIRDIKKIGIIDLTFIR